MLKKASWAERGEKIVSCLPQGQNKEVSLCVCFVRLLCVAAVVLSISSKTQLSLLLGEVVSTSEPRISFWGVLNIIPPVSCLDAATWDAGVKGQGLLLRLSHP